MVDSEGQECVSVGNDILDAQHAKLLELIREIKSVPQDADPLLEYRMACKALRELADYTHAHFSEEERVMENAGYPNLEAHKKEHDCFLKRVFEIEEAMHFGEGVTSLNTFCGLLEEWWRNHILLADRHYAPYLQASPSIA
jgi:hemerythrin